MDELTRRRALEVMIGSGAFALVGCESSPSATPRLGPSAAQRSVVEPSPPPSTGEDAIVAVEPLQTPWQTRDPFLFCMHHDDRYPAGNAHLGPAASLAGHQMGRDFAGVDGWRMYHGQAVPGFPRHPHRGFETVTVVRRGLLDHSDSLGATARYGRGDVQWLTAGAGIMHAEMFPLLRQEEGNPLELFQIWLNLPSSNKMVAPHFSMLWQPTIPIRELTDDAGRRTRLTLVAGRWGDVQAPSPPPHSWASEPDGEVAIWTLAMEPGAAFTLPAAREGVNRSLYFFGGTGLRVGGRTIPDRQHVVVEAQSDLALTAGPVPTELLVLSGRPIGEPVARHGPFVMNTESEIRQAYADYRQTHFGPWPWPSDEPVHSRTHERFARRPDGTVETPG